MITNWVVIDIYTIIILICLLWFSHKKEVMSSMRGKFLNILLEMTLFMLFSDILFRYSGSGSFLNSILIKIGNTFLNIGGPFLLILLYRYIDGWLTLDAARTRVWSSLILTIVLINITLVFTLNAANILYYSEIMIIIKAIFYGLFILYLIKYKNEIKKSYKNTLISSMFFPFIFTLIQLGVNNIQTEYIGLTLAYLILIINIQRKDMSEDALTGATNRRMLNIELEDRIELAKTGSPFSAFMIDIDYFKKINDTYGHDVGDKVLKDVSNILQSSFRKEDVVARYGGDEFCVLTDISDEEILNKIKDRINERVLHYNQTNPKSPQINLSIGFKIYDNKYLTSTNFIHAIDETMYKQKEKNHSFLKENASTILA